MTAMTLHRGQMEYIQPPQNSQVIYEVCLLCRIVIWNTVHVLIF